MRLFILLTTLVLSLSALANDLAHAPASFDFSGGHAVFADFTKATYNIRYDMNSKLAAVEATIELTTADAGRIIFDLKAEPSSITLDGKATSQDLISLPENASKVRALKDTAAIGKHTLVITVPLTRLLEWSSEGVKSAFWTTDLDDRGYLEAYMPANLEFDRVPMMFKLEFVGGTKNQRIYTNGLVVGTGAGKFEVTYPEYFTSSSIFFHTAPEGAMNETSFIYRSIDGRELPVVIYKKPSIWGGSDAGTLSRLQQNTINILTELENDYGPFLHPSVTIYNAGSGGMEYCGATMTDSGALGHELTHSYFARGIMPANGNAGWIDEAVASWRDNRYPRSSSISGSANMAGRAGYTRYTDTAAYSFGARFMAYLDGKFASQGGLKSLLRKLVEEKSFQPFFTEDFISWAEGHYRMDLKTEFKERVYGGKSQKQSESSIHRKMSIEEMQGLL